MDYLSQLPVDQNITYLPFSDVSNICKSNTKLHGYCTDPRYKNNWKRLIDNTFGNTVSNYSEKLEKIWNKFGLNKDTYNYIVYTNLVKVLDPITQGMIYYKQGDTKSFENITQKRKFLSMFLIGKKELMKKYLPESDWYFNYNDY